MENPQSVSRGVASIDLDGHVLAIRARSLSSTTVSPITFVWCSARRTPVRFKGRTRVGGDLPPPATGRAQSGVMLMSSQVITVPLVALEKFGSGAANTCPLAGWNVRVSCVHVSTTSVTLVPSAVLT